MVKISQQISDFQEPEEKETYTILSVEETTQQNFKGLSVIFEPLKRQPEDKTQYKVTAWFGQKGYVGSKSKLGAFISAFSDFYEKTENPDKAIELAQDSDNWINHIVKVLEWREKNRELKVIS